MQKSSKYKKNHKKVHRVGKPGSAHEREHTREPADAPATKCMSEYKGEAFWGVSVQRDMATKTSCTGVVKA